MRLITRGDLDGLACAVILTQHEDIGEILLVHPQEIADGEVEVESDDIIANLPYHPACGMWFDHHLLTPNRPRPEGEFRGRYAEAPSAAQLIWEHYGSERRYDRLVDETNRLDSAQLSESDVTHPEGYILLGFTLDGRTGFGAFEIYFRQCVEWVKTLPVDEVLRQPVVADRVRRMRDEDRSFRKALLDASRLEGNVVVTDFRSELVTPIGNRFLVYTLFPQANVSLRLHWGPDRQFVVAAVAHSIFDRSCRINVGELMARYGGGGHKGAGSVPLPVEEAEPKIAEMLATLKEVG